MGKIQVVGDLKKITEADLDLFGIKDILEKRRIMEMVQGDNDAKQLFKMQSKLQALSIVSLFVSDQSKIEDLLTVIGDEKITGFQLKDAFDSSSNLLEVKRIIQAKVNHNRFILEGLGED